MEIPNIELLGNRVLILEDSSETRTRGGIIIPDTAKETPTRGLVIAVGPGEDDEIPMRVKTGQKVIYGKYAGSEITLNGREYKIVRNTDIIAIIPEKPIAGSLEINFPD